MKHCVFFAALLLAACSRSTEPHVRLTQPGDRLEPVVNLPWWQYRQDFGNVSGWLHQGVSRATPPLGQLKQAGVSTVVWFLLADGVGAVQFAPDGSIAGLNANFLADYRAALALAEQQGMSIVWVLMDHLWAKPAQREKGAMLFGNAASLNDPRQFIDHVLNPILATDSPAIAGWIVMNEPEVILQEGWATESVVVKFLDAVSRQIKLRQPSKPVSIGHVDYESMIEFQARHGSLPQDFLTFHHYKAYLPPPAPKLGKPIYVGEFSFNEAGLLRPTADWAALAGWVKQLGYAGLWPWSATQSGHVQQSEIAAFTRALAAPGTAQLPDDRAARAAQIRLWQEGAAKNRAEIAINTAKLADTEVLLRSEVDGLTKDQQELDNALQARQKLTADFKASTGRLLWMRWVPFGGEALALEQSNQQQLQTRMQPAVQWVTEAEANVQKRRRQLNEQHQWKQIYEARIRGNQYQLQKVERLIPKPKSP